MVRPEQALSTLRRILVPLDSKVTAPASMVTAFIVARNMGAHVDVLLIGEDPTLDEDKYPPNVEDQPPPEGTERVRGEQRIAQRRQDDVRGMFDELCARHGFQVVEGIRPPGPPSAGWHVDQGEPGRVVARHGRRSDLIVLGKPTTISKMRSRIKVNSALFETGRPVLVAPGEPPRHVGRKIAVAWNDTAEASRAVAAAMRFVVRADSVVVLTAESDRTPAAVAQELADYIAYHGVHAEPRVFASMGDRPLGGKELLRACLDAGADMLVMGAYGVSSFRERVMGPATQQMLEAATIPILMAR